MLRLLIKKKSLTGILSSLLLLTACDSATVVRCHQFNNDERHLIGQEITKLPADSPIRWVDKDYQRVCISLK